MSLGKVLITRWLPEEGLVELRRWCSVEMNPADQPWDPASISERLADKDGLLVVGDRIDQAAMQAAPRLRVISGYGVGYDNIDVAAATAAGIIVTNLPDEVVIATAELTLGLLLATSRRIAEADRLLRSHALPSWGASMLWGIDLFGKTLGIVGMGRIGTAVAERAKAFGMRILYTARSSKPEAERALGATRVELGALLAESDVVSLHTPLTPQTRHLIGAAELRRMKPGALLVNMARGPVVDEAALIAALEEGHLGGAGLDVFDREPHIPSALRGMRNVVITPHLGTASRDTRIRMAARAADNVLAVLRGGRPERVVNP